jgi:hypothetical protein
MKIYSFEKLNINNDGFYDLFEKTIVNRTDLYGRTFLVTDEYEGRLDLISKYIYGSTDYVEELMAANNIYNPWSVKSGDELKVYNSSEVFASLYKTDEIIGENKDTILMMNKNKTNKIDNNRIGSPPPIKPDNLKQLTINYSKRKISIINKFK